MSLATDGTGPATGSSVCPPQTKKACSQDWSQVPVLALSLWFRGSSHKLKHENRKKRPCQMWQKHCPCKVYNVATHKLDICILLAHCLLLLLRHWNNPQLTCRHADNKDVFLSVKMTEDPSKLNHQKFIRNTYFKMQTKAFQQNRRGCKDVLFFSPHLYNTIFELPLYAVSYTCHRLINSHCCVCGLVTAKQSESHLCTLTGVAVSLFATQLFHSEGASSGPPRHVL